MIDLATCATCYEDFPSDEMSWNDEPGLEIGLHCTTCETTN
jgi:hypothetical protein